MPDPRQSEKVIVGSQSLTESANNTSQEKKARIASILERGFVGDRLEVPLPGNLYGEWVSKDPMNVSRMQALGFQLDTEFAVNRALHNTGVGQVDVGDVVFMTTTRENKELIDEVQRDLFERNNNPKRKNQKEETEASLLDKQGLPSVVSSKSDSVGAEEIIETLQSQT